MREPLDEQLGEPEVAFVGGDRQCRILGAGHWRRIDVSAFIQQNAAHLHVATRRRLHQRCEASLPQTIIASQFSVTRFSFDANAYNAITRLEN